MVRSKLLRAMGICMTIIFLISSLSTMAFSQSQKIVKLKFINYFSAGEPDANTIGFRTVFDKFVKSNRNIRIDEENLAHDVYETKMKILAAANQLPDLFLIKGSWTSDYVKNKLLRSLDDILGKDPKWKSTFKEGAFSNFIIAGKTYGIPFQITSTVFYYNKNIFKKVGISSFPKTWSEFLTAIDKLKAAKYIPIALGNKAKWVVESCIFSTLANRFTGTDWYENLRNKKGAKFTDPQFVKALTALQQLAKRGAFNPDFNSIDNYQQRTLYYNKKAAMFAEGTWAISQVTTDAPKDVLQATELGFMPSVPGGKGNPLTITGGAGWGYAVNSKLESSKVDAVAKILKTVTSTENARIVVENNGIPAVKPSKYDKAKLSPLMLKFNSLVEDNKLTFIPVYDHQLSASIIDTLNTGLQMLMIGEITPQELAKKLQQEYEKSN